MHATPTAGAALPLPQDVRTLPQLFAWRAAQTPAARAYLEYDSASQRWSGPTWQEMHANVNRWLAALATLDLRAGARVAILLPNGVSAVCIDQATLAAGGVPVPLHALDNPASIAYILADSEASLLVVADIAQWQTIAHVGQALPALRLVVTLQPPAEAARARSADPVASTVPVITAADWLASAPASGPPALPAATPPTEDDLAALVYTSGTTGRPKGVMLTHGNVVANVRASLAMVAPNGDDVFLSFLPLSHTFERTAGYYLPIAAGATVAFARSVQQLPEDFKTVRPTVLISVPRIYERVYAKVQSTLAPHPVRAWLFASTVSVGWRRFCRQQGLPMDGRVPAVIDALAWAMLRPLVARPLLAQFGGRVRAALSGGAALSQPVARCFLGLGLPLLQGYGMTESSPVVAVNTPDDNDPATVGRLLDGVEARFDDRGELLVRGPNVMRGYWKRPEDTAQALEDGWLHTGDLAVLDQGRLRIVGRVKEIIVTSTGEKVPPADLELAITADPLFEQAFVVGENRPFIACVVVLGQSAWRALAQQLGLEPADPASLQAGAARAAALDRIRTLTAAFPYYAQPRAVTLTLTPWTLENSLMTPTLKLKRKNLAAHFAADIDRMYQR